MSSLRTCNIVFGYDSRMLFEGLDCKLSSTEEFNILSGLTNNGSLISLLNKIEDKTNLLILELEELDLSSIDYVKGIVDRFPAIKILIILNSLANGRINAMMKTGIKGMVLRKCSFNDLKAAIRKIHSGSLFYCGSVSAALLEEMKVIENRSAINISPRELGVLKEVVRGKSNNEIAVLLDISVSTVKTHRQNIMNKMDARNLIELLQKVHINGILPPDEDPLSAGCRLSEDNLVIQETSQL